MFDFYILYWTPLINSFSIILQLVSQYKLDKTLLPPKKLFGNQTEAFIKKRQRELEIYLQTVLHHLTQVPQALGTFLDFPKYVSQLDLSVTY